MISQKFAILIILSMFLVLGFSVAVQPALAILSVRITSPAPGSIPLPSGQTMMLIRAEFQGTRDAGDASPIREFRCSWDGSPYLRANCLSMSMSETRTATGWIMTGRAEKSLGAGSHNFGVQVVNSLTTPSIRSATWQFTITTPPPPVVTPPVSGAPIDYTLTPSASVYKANSYNIAATTYNPAIGANNQYHFANGEITPYDKMYIVFEAFYGSNPDIFDRGSRTTFECRWDFGSTFGPCGRFNFVQSVAPGGHRVDFRAVNPSGVRGPEGLFTWCVSGCINYFDFRPISSSIDVRSFSGAPGENITIQDLKKFPVLNETIGKNNQTLSVKDLNILSSLNQTINTNNTSVTNFSTKDLQVNQSNKT